MVRGRTRVPQASPRAMTDTPKPRRDSVTHGEMEAGIYAPSGIIEVMLLDRTRADAEVRRRPARGEARTDQRGEADRRRLQAPVLIAGTHHSGPPRRRVDLRPRSSGPFLLPDWSSSVASLAALAHSNLSTIDDVFFPYRSPPLFPVRLPQRGGSMLGAVVQVPQSALEWVLFLAIASSGFCMLALLMIRDDE